MSGFFYKSEQLLHIAHEEGRALKLGDYFRYEFNLTDHLGNVRVSFSDVDYDGAIEEAEGEVLQVDHYYPFGMRMGGLSYNSGTENRYRYNGKEYHQELNLGLYDYGARMYDPAIGRFTGIDALAEEYQMWSPNSYVFDNPIRFVDPDGMEPEDIIFLDGDNNIIRRIEQEGRHEYRRVSYENYYTSSEQIVIEEIESPVAITFNPGINQEVVSDQSLNTLEEIGLESGVSEINITSTARDAEGQATAMYDNLVRDYDHQRETYRQPGQEVINTFDEAQAAGLDRAGTIESMTNRINELGPENVSRHAANPNELNVVDISQRNVPTERHTLFINAANRRNGVRALNENRVFHVEIQQNN